MFVVAAVVFVMIDVLALVIACLFVCLRDGMLAGVAWFGELLLCVIGCVSACLRV